MVLSLIFHFFKILLTEFLEIRIFLPVYYLFLFKFRASLFIEIGLGRLRLIGGIRVFVLNFLDVSAIEGLEQIPFFLQGIVHIDSIALIYSPFQTVVEFMTLKLLLRLNLVDLVLSLVFLLDYHVGIKLRSLTNIKLLDLKFLYIWYIFRFLLFLSEFEIVVTKVVLLLGGWT